MPTAAISALTLAGGGGAPTTLKLSIDPRPLKGSSLVAATAVTPGSVCQTVGDRPHAAEKRWILGERGALQHHPHRHGTIGDEARIDPRELDETSNQQPGRDQQHDGKRRLGHHQRATQAMTTAIASPSACMDELQQASSSRLQRRDDAEHQRREDGARKAKSTTVPLTATASRRGMSAGCAHTSTRTAAYASSTPTAPPTDAQHDGLCHELPHQPSAAGAKRRPHRQFATARRAAREQQAGDVGAGDQQHQRDGAEQHEQRRACFADQQLEQRRRAEGEALVGVGKRLLQELADAPDVGVDRVVGHTRSARAR